MENKILSWEELVEKEWQDYKRHGAKGKFSHEGHAGAEWFGKNISRFHGKFLDIGCGVIPYPSYMKYPEGEWWGIDPLDGDSTRMFNFTKGVAEELPFSDNTFDLAVFATSLDHLANVETAVTEARRVVKKDGHIAVWTSLRKEDAYDEWKKNGGMADEHHLTMFTKKTIVEIFNLPIGKWESFPGNHCIIFKNIK